MTIPDLFFLAFKKKIGKPLTMNKWNASMTQIHSVSHYHTFLQTYSTTMKGSFVESNHVLDHDLLIENRT